ncbi:hypothetical protein EB008_06990, partial [bacterium]|nr:hypothetical protein [bacterium]
MHIRTLSFGIDHDGKSFVQMTVGYFEALVQFNMKLLNRIRIRLFKESLDLVDCFVRIIKGFLIKGSFFFKSASIITFHEITSNRKGAI